MDSLEIPTDQQTQMHIKHNYFSHQTFTSILKNTRQDRQTLIEWIKEVRTDVKLEEILNQEAE